MDSKESVDVCPVVSAFRICICVLIHVWLPVNVLIMSHMFCRNNLFIGVTLRTLGYSPRMCDFCKSHLLSYNNV